MSVKWGQIFSELGPSQHSALLLDDGNTGSPANPDRCRQLLILVWSGVSGDSNQKEPVVGFRFYSLFFILPSDVVPSPGPLPH